VRTLLKDYWMVVASLRTCKYAGFACTTTAVCLLPLLLLRAFTTLLQLVEVEVEVVQEGMEGLLYADAGQELLVILAMQT